ncbi:hypothetical protein HanHA89_Chr09g0322941 [Helianthus annuus]|nr:hypothetical protein HanHA89_Chr09g0322941 [Helianthus annuus]
MRWALEVAEAEELLKWWRREVAPVGLKAAEVEVEVVVRLRASSISSLSSILTSIWLGFLRSIV